METWGDLGDAMGSSGPGSAQPKPRRWRPCNAEAPRANREEKQSPWAGPCWSWEEDGVSKGSALTHCLQALGFFPKQRCWLTGMLVQTLLKPVEKLSQTPAPSVTQGGC